MAQVLDIETKRQRIAANWRLEDLDEVPFVITVGPFHGAVQQYYESDAAELKWNEDHHKQREGVYDYAFPHIKPNIGIGIVAAAFGCESRVNNEADPWITALIKEENAEDVYDLKVPDPLNNPAYQRAWDRLDWMQAHSDLPLRVLNVPSPLVTASLIWEYTGFIEALVVFPDEVHALMDKITEATILYVKEQFKRIKNLYGVSHEMWAVPRECGIRVSDDTAAILSPDLYREFGVKYNGRIAEAFGGIVIHSCGDVSNMAPVMMETPHLKGLDFTIPQVENWAKVRDAVAGKTGLCFRQFYWDHLADSKVNLADYAKKLVDFFGRKGVFIETSTPTGQEAVALGEELHKVLSR
jgi:hypothetical protein